MDTLARFTLEHRRLLAAVFAGLAVLAALSSRSDAAGTPVLVTSQSLSSGTVLTRDDLRTVHFSPASVPEGVVTSPDDLVGRRVAGPMNAGEPFTFSRVLDPASLDGYGAASVLASVRIAEPDAVAAIRAGDVVDVVAVDPHGEHTAEVVARSVTVVTVPDEIDDDRAVTLGIATDEPTALALASAAITSRFALLLSRRD